MSYFVCCATNYYTFLKCMLEYVVYNAIELLFLLSFAGYKTKMELYILIF